MASSLFRGMGSCPLPFSLFSQMSCAPSLSSTRESSAIALISRQSGCALEDTGSSQSLLSSYLVKNRDDRVVLLNSIGFVWKSSRSQ